MATNYDEIEGGCWMNMVRIMVSPLLGRGVVIGESVEGPDAGSQVPTFRRARLFDGQQKFLPVFL